MVCIVAEGVVWGLVEGRVEGLIAVVEGLGERARGEEIL